MPGHAGLPGGARGGEPALAVLRGTRAFPGGGGQSGDVGANHARVIVMSGMASLLVVRSITMVF